MINEAEELVKEYSIIGIVITAFTVLIRPFVSIKQTLRDSAIVFIFTILAGVIFEGFDISPYFKLGFSGCIGFWAVRLYEILCSLFVHLKENPDKIISKVERK